MSQEKITIQNAYFCSYPATVYINGNQIDGFFKGTVIKPFRNASIVFIDANNTPHIVMPVDYGAIKTLLKIINNMVEGNYRYARNNYNQTVIDYVVIDSNTITITVNNGRNGKSTTFSMLKADLSTLYNFISILEEALFMIEKQDISYVVRQSNNQQNTQQSVQQQSNPFQGQPQQTVSQPVSPTPQQSIPQQSGNTIANSPNPFTGGTQVF